MNFRIALKKNILGLEQILHSVIMAAFHFYFEEKIWTLISTASGDDGAPLLNLSVLFYL